MIGLMYHGEVRYISSFEDFKEVMDAEVYEVLRQFFTCYEARITELEGDYACVLRGNDELRSELETANDELADYKQLERQDRLLKLSCKIGDIIYEVCPLTGKITQRKIRRISVYKCPDLTIMYETGYGYFNRPDEFGKTVFFTRSEAEAKQEELRKER